GDPVELREWAALDQQHCYHRRGQRRLCPDQQLRQLARGRGPVHDQRNLPAHRNRHTNWDLDRHRQRQRQPADRQLDGHRGSARSERFADVAAVLAAVDWHHQRTSEGDFVQHWQRTFTDQQYRNQRRQQRRLRPDQQLRQLTRCGSELYDQRNV